MVRTKSSGSSAARAGQRRAFDLHQHVDRHRFRMLRQARQRRDQPGAVVVALAHADDAAAADVDAGAAHGAERIEPVLIDARGDDLAVEFRRGVEIVVVVVEAGRLEPLRLRLGQHAERGAAFEPERAHAFDHGADLLEVAILRLAPGGAHAEAARAGALGGARLGQHGVDAHQLLGLDAGRVFRALRTIGAVFRAAAGLDREQRRDLHLGGIEMAIGGRSARGTSAPGTAARTARGPPRASSRGGPRRMFRASTAIYRQLGRHRHRTAFRIPRACCAHGDAVTLPSHASQATVPGTRPERLSSRVDKDRTACWLSRSGPVAASRRVPRLSTWRLCISAHVNG